MDYTTQITDLRTRREQIINDFRKEKGQDEEHFEYYPIDERWKLVGNVTIRKPREGMEDYSIKFSRVGKIDVDFGNNNLLKFNLYQIENEEDSLYIYIKDGTSGISSYGLGRFIPVFKEKDSYSVDFNLAFTPACGHVEGTACPLTRESTGVAIEAGEKAERH